LKWEQEGKRTNLTLMVDGFLRLYEDGHGALREIEQRLVEESRATESPVRVAFNAQAVLTRHGGTWNLYE